LLAKFCTFSVNFVLQELLLLVKKSEVGDLCLEQFDFKLSGLDILLVLLHFLARSANLTLYHIKLPNYSLNLTCQLVAALLRPVVTLFCRLSCVQLILNFCVNLAAEFLFDILDFLVVDFHRLLVFLLLLIVDLNHLLNFSPDFLVFTQLTSSFVLFVCKFVLDHCHLLLETNSQLRTLLSLFVKHLLVFQVELGVLLNQHFAHDGKSLAFLFVRLNLNLQVFDLA
jgi:hypothetical protein